LAAELEAKLLEIRPIRVMDLSGKSALITGGTRNTGRAIAQVPAEAVDVEALLVSPTERRFE
jgi:hypothetical protein